jgi:hypothetical protein
MILALAVTSLAVAADQQPLTDIVAGSPTHSAGDIFDGALRTRIGDILRHHMVTGYSVGILRLGHPSSHSMQEDGYEFAQWGNRTETGEAVTKDISHSIHIVVLSHLKLSHRRS